jgi:hypothetical protein
MTSVCTLERTPSTIHLESGEAFMLVAKKERGFANYPYLAEHDPFMARLRDEPRFVGILERCRTEWERFNAPAKSQDDWMQ